MNPSILPSLHHPERLSVLRSLGLLDTPSEESFDRLTRLASRFLHAPIALVSLVDEDRQFFKSSLGLPEPWATLREAPLSHSFCQHLLTSEGSFVVGDARIDPRVCDSLAVPELNVIAYLGIPLVTAEGHVLGSFCVIDTEPREWTDEEALTLRELTASVMSEIELRLSLFERENLLKEREIEEKEIRFQAHLLDVVDQAVIVTDLEGKIIYWNRFAKVLYGWEAEEVVGRNVTEITPAELSQEQSREIMARLQEGERCSGEFWVQRRDGSTFPAMVTDTPIYGEDGGIIGVIGVSSDLSERKQAEAERENLLRETQLEREAAEVAHAHLEDVLDSITEAFFVLDNEWRYSYLNKAALDFLGSMGKKSEDLLRCVLWEVFPELVGTAVEEKFRYSLDQQHSTQFEFYYRPFDLWLEIRVHPLVDGIIFYTQDITQQKRSLEEMRSLQSRARCILWGGAGHSGPERKW